MSFINLISDGFVIAYGLSPVITVITTVVFGLASILIAAAFFLGVNKLEILFVFCFIYIFGGALLYQGSAFQSYLLLKKSHDLTVQEFIKLEKEVRTKEREELRLINSEKNKLKKAEEKYGLNHDKKDK